MKMKCRTFLFVACITLCGCATTAERTAQQAETSKKVTLALDERHYKIGIDNMSPMRGPSRTVSFGYSVEVRNDSLISYLPYFGRAYTATYGGGNAMDFSAPIKTYQETKGKKGQRKIEIVLTTSEDNFQYTIEVFDNGSASIDVQPRNRDRISYSGEMVF